VHSKGGSDIFLAELNTRLNGDDSVTDFLWSAVRTRAGELAIELGHPGGVLDVGIHRVDEAKQAAARRYGFAPATSFHRMRIEFDGPMAAPEPPPGVTMRDGTSDEMRREGHFIHEDAFAEHFGFVAIPFDRWFAFHDSASTTDWTQLQVAHLDGEPAAVLIGSDLFVTDGNYGYVATLGVRPTFRGHGLGRFLLLTAFAADAARGRKGSVLHVDANNTTPALGLYTSAGMHLDMVIDAWQRRF
jgi:mycothiol synthase